MAVFEPRRAAGGSRRLGLVIRARPLVLAFRRPARARVPAVGLATSGLASSLAWAVEAIFSEGVILQFFSFRGSLPRSGHSSLDWPGIARRFRTGLNAWRRNGDPARFNGRSPSNRRKCSRLAVSTGLACNFPPAESPGPALPSDDSFPKLGQRLRTPIERRVFHCSRCWFHSNAAVNLRSDGSEIRSCRASAAGRNRISS